jgi:hypothetical protein
VTSEDSRQAPQPKRTKPYRGIEAAHRIDPPHEAVFGGRDINVSGEDITVATGEVSSTLRKPREPLVDERIPSLPPLSDISSGPHGDDSSPLDLYGTPIPIDEPGR